MQIVSGRKGIKQAADHLRSSNIVAFPTETVYGLGGMAYNDDAVAKIFEAKSRPNFNPLIIHVADFQTANCLVDFCPRSLKLAETFWPGPLTIVLNRANNSEVSLLAGAGLKTTAIRMPDNDIALDLIREAGGPIAAPSANKSGRVSPTRAIHVSEEFGDTIPCILDGGPCLLGLESTVIDFSDAMPTILRPGSITKQDIEEVLGKIALDTGKKPRVAPGMMARHYAPSAKLRLNAKTKKTGETLVGFGPEAPQDSINLSPTGNLREAAAKLFFTLRELDKRNIIEAAIMPIPETGLGVAINDRLRRASKK